MVIEKNTNEANLQQLAEDFKYRKRMALFLGAGINLGDSICVEGCKEIDLSWNGLLNGLFTEAFSLLSIGKELSSEDRYIMQNLICVSNKKEIAKGFSEENWERLRSHTSFEFPPLVQASIIKSVLGNNYINSIRKHLYQQCDKYTMQKIFFKYYGLNSNLPDTDKNRPFYSLYQLARLIILHHSIIAVVTYNFDKFLTMAIDILRENREEFFTEKEMKNIRQDRTVEDVFGTYSHSSQEKDVLPIYHIHGLIPPYNEFLPVKDNEIVLSMEEFYENTQNVYSWQTATQLHFLCHFTCLFLGSSLTDINTQRMIHYASKIGNDDKIYYLHAVSKSMKERLNEKEYTSYLHLMNIKDTFYTQYGLTPIFDKNGYNHLYDTILNLYYETV
ncbi:SIR2 family protein [Bacteroides uniformis]|uniref:SIR2 family protein n=2 Tax=Bacteroides TaxID=816 RepID=UPI00232CE6B7|nr:SIR2 family protein [Bacteroides uniformis]MDC1767439.1 SIR2 family protein [Bacteroides uniformis]MDC1771063.1 SIR2 family protein [Bacteroides uniformis]MDC1777301.1 SIR2 family protein [Bacteroides uniformis]MDC1778801.1 SIR2 family protein [Bacteroides uniformis]